MSMCHSPVQQRSGRHGVGCSAVWVQMAGSGGASALEWGRKASVPFPRLCAQSKMA